MSTDNRERDKELVRIITDSIDELTNNYWARLKTDNEWAMSYLVTLENRVVELTKMKLTVLGYLK